VHLTERLAACLPTKRIESNQAGHLHVIIRTSVRFEDLSTDREPIRAFCGELMWRRDLIHIAAAQRLDATLQLHGAQFAG